MSDNTKRKATLKAAIDATDDVSLKAALSAALKAADNISLKSKLANYKIAANELYKLTAKYHETSAKNKLQLSAREAAIADKNAYKDVSDAYNAVESTYRNIVDSVDTIEKSVSQARDAFDLLNVGLKRVLILLCVALLVFYFGKSQQDYLDYSPRIPVDSLCREEPTDANCGKPTKIVNKSSINAVILSMILLSVLGIVVVVTLIRVSFAIRAASVATQMTKAALDDSLSVDEYRNLRNKMDYYIGLAKPWVA